MHRSEAICPCAAVIRSSSRTGPIKTSLESWAPGQWDKCRQQQRRQVLCPSLQPLRRIRMATSQCRPSLEPEMRSTAVGSSLVENTFPLRDVLVSWERTQSGDRVIEISSSDAPALDELALLAKVFHVLRMEPGTRVLRRRCSCD